MKKLEGWPERLAKYVTSVYYTEWAWGSFDCCIHVADAVQAISGEDFASSFRGQYNDAASAMRELVKFSGGALIPTLTKLSEIHGWEVCSPKKAQRGDIVLLDAAAFNADERFDGILGIHLGHVVSFAAAERRGWLACNTMPPPKGPVTHAWHIL